MIHLSLGQVIAVAVLTGTLAGFLATFCWREE